MPLELLFVGVVFLARVLSLEKLNFKVFASISALWFAMLVLGIIGSSIALLTLLDPLQHYLSFQAVQSKFLNQPKYWYLTLLDPWSFAKDVTNSPFENGQTIWISSNPVAFALAISGSITGMFFAKGRWNRTWVATFSGVVLFGVLGFAGIFGLINVLAIPVLNMIAMQRFLGFLWWPAFAVLVGFGVDSLVDRRGRQGLIFGFFVTALAIAILWLDVIKKGPKLFAVIASQNYRFYDNEESPNFDSSFRLAHIGLYCCKIKCI